MGVINKTYTFVNGAGNLIDAVQVNANFDQLFTLQAGNINYQNLAVDAAIRGSQVATAADGIGTNNLVDKAVTDPKIAYHATDDAQRAISKLHLKDLSVMKAHIDLREYSHANQIIISASTPLTTIDTGISSADYTPIAWYTTVEFSFDLVVRLLVNAGTLRFTIANPNLSGGNIAANTLKMLYLKNTRT